MRRLPNETQWLEFKHNNYMPDMIGKDISALANSATLYDKDQAYMLWGIDDATHEIIGTNYNLQTLKKGNQELETWLRELLSRNADFEFHSVQLDNKNVGLLIIRRAANQPVTFEKFDYIRVGSYTKKLNDYPELQSQLWDKIRSSNFEERRAKQDLELQDALQQLDYTAYFDFINIPQPTGASEIAHYLLEESILAQQDDGLFSITNLGAILLAKRLSDFPRLSRKAVRVVQYSDNNRLKLLKQDTILKGYVVGFEGLMKYIEALIPTEEVIERAIREQRTAYPLLAIREIVSNALIHQDFSITGSGPVVEIFKDRIEVTNPGAPLVDIERIIDNPPRSRNEKLASLMRRLGMCEELGSGWDKIGMSCEAKQLPAPKIELYEENTRVILYSKKEFSTISLEDKLWACYLHACIKQVQGEQLTNASFRARFNLPSSASGSVSRLLKEAVRRKYLKPFNSTNAPRYMKYVPIWA